MKKFQKIQLMYSHLIRVFGLPKALIPVWIVCGILMMVSCQFNSKPDTNEIKDNLVYFKDPRTGLCFAAVNSTNTKSLSNSSSITCVPCDSLKNVEVK